MGLISDWDNFPTATERQAKTHMKFTLSPGRSVKPLGGTEGRKEGREGRRQRERERGKEGERKKGREGCRVLILAVNKQVKLGIKNQGRTG